MEQRLFRGLSRDLQFLVRLYESAKANDTVALDELARQTGMPDETEWERTDILNVSRRLVAEGYAVEPDPNTLSITKAGISRVKQVISSVDRLEGLV